MFLNVIKLSILSTQFDGFSQSVYTHVTTSQIKMWGIINAQVASLTPPPNLYPLLQK